jgi:F-type H+-transporting ATPase subunit alpha
MQLKPSEISDLIRQRLQSYEATAEARTEGTIVLIQIFGSAFWKS